MYSHLDAHFWFPPLPVHTACFLTFPFFFLPLSLGDPPHFPAFVTQHSFYIHPWNTYWTTHKERGCIGTQMNRIGPCP